MICTEYRVENAPDRNPGITATYIADGPNITGTHENTPK